MVEVSPESGDGGPSQEKAETGSKRKENTATGESDGGAGSPAKKKTHTVTKSTSLDGTSTSAPIFGAAAPAPELASISQKAGKTSGEN